MYRKSDMAKLEAILKYIDDIYTIIKHHETVEKSLLDLEGQYAIMMCFTQIGELLSKIESNSLRETLPIKYAVAFRNIIVRDYDGIDFILAKHTVKESLPQLADTIKGILNKFSSSEFHK